MASIRSLCLTAAGLSAAWKCHFNHFRGLQITVCSLKKINIWWKPAWGRTNSRHISFIHLTSIFSTGEGFPWRQWRLKPLSLSCLSRKDPEGQIILKSHFPLFSQACLGLIKALHHQNLHFHVKWERGADISIFMNSDALNHVKLRTQGKPPKLSSPDPNSIWHVSRGGTCSHPSGLQRGLLLECYKYFARSEVVLRASHLWAQSLKIRKYKTKQKI